MTDTCVQLDPDGIAFTPIGFVRSSHVDISRTPIQPVYAQGCAARLEILPQYGEGLDDIGGFSHLHILYYFHKADPAVLKVIPFLDDVPRGVFATRATRRPNPVGLSLVRLVRRDGNVLYIEDADVLDGTPVIDVKPFIPRFDVRVDVRAGWQESVAEETAQRRGRRSG